ncbi:unnamed protein product, partial [Closterium sp. NIES-64]
MGYRGRAGGGVRVLSLGGQEVADPRVFSVRGTGGEGVSTPTMDSSGRVLVQPLGMRAAVAPQYSPVQSRGSAAGAASRASPGTGSAAGSGLKGGGGGGVGRPARTVSAIPRMEGLGGSVPGGNTSGAGALKSPTRAGFFQLAQVGEEGERGEGEADNLPMLPPPGLPQVVQAPQNVPPPPHVHSAPFFACSEVHFEAPQNVLPPPHVHSAPLFSPFSHLFPSVPALRAASGDPCRAAAHQEGCAQAALHEVHVHLPLALPSPLNVSISLFFSILVPFPADSPADISQCQHCGQLLEIPAVLPPTKKGVHKLRCGKCIGLSRFRAFIPHMPHLQLQQPFQPQQQPHHHQQQPPLSPPPPLQQQQQQQQQGNQQHVRSSSFSAIDATKQQQQQQYLWGRSASTDSTEARAATALHEKSSIDGAAATVRSPGAASNGTAHKGSGGVLGTMPAAAAAGSGRGRSSRGTNSSPSKPLKSGLGPGRSGSGLAAGPRTGLGAGSATGSDGQGRIGRAGSFESLRCNSAGMLSPVGSVRNSSDSESPAGTPPAKVGSKGGDARATSSSSMGRVDSGSALVGGGGGMASTGNKMGSAGGVVLGQYDQVAGFWGQMGGPCLGMIPPGIDLGPALPKNCSGGNTKVYVNARELHRKDLDRLVKRGLPLTDNMAYRVEANGNVFDGLSGEFLVNLGKLAPS